MRLWIVFFARRAVALVVILFGLALASFGMVRLIPGDAALSVAGPSATEAEVQGIRHELGLDLPLPEQFLRDFTRLSHGDLGTSFILKQRVDQVIASRLPQSLQLASVALFLVLVLGIPVGVIAGALTRQGKHPRAELVFAAVTSIGGSLPEFLAATFLAFIFAVWLRLLPVAGTEGPQSLVLPAVSVVLRPVCVLSRIVRVETLNVLAQDYIRTARSKRLPAWVIYLRHTVPNVLTAALTVGGLLFAGLIGGAVVVENVFARAGLGTSLVNAVTSRDYPIIQATILLLGVTVVAVNTIIDVALAIADPRSLARHA